MKPTINETLETKQIKNKQQQKLKSGGNKETNKNHQEIVKIRSL